MFKDAILLVTGGTGSFGNAVAKRFLETEIKEIRIFSRDEKKQDDMRKHYHNDKLKFFIGDIRDYNSLRHAMFNVDYVFSAAALKQVPSCEFFPIEAVKTNILGIENVIRAAREAKVSKVIALSTDKAAYPVNAMGISKALMEKVVIANSRMGGDTVLCSTRYGNVMASRGSVIPLFINLLKQGKPLTITNPKMTRYMMSLDDAVNLVLFAFEHGEQGDMFVQKAPAATIRILAEALTDLFEVPCNIKQIGTRHGEKLHETLLTSEEVARAEDLGSYYKVYPDNRDLNYAKFFSEGDIVEHIPYTSENTNRLDVQKMKELLLSLEYVRDELKLWKK